MSTGASNAWGCRRDDAILAVPDFFHCNGWAIPFFGPMYGAKLVLPGRRADTEWLHELIVSEGITVGPGVPTIWLSMLDHCVAGAAWSLGRMKRYLLRRHRAAGRHDRGLLAQLRYQNDPRLGHDRNDQRLHDLLRAVRAWRKPEALAVMRTPGQTTVRQRNPHPSTTTIARLPKDGKTPGNLQARGAWIAGGYFRRPDVDAAVRGRLAAHRRRRTSTRITRSALSTAPRT